MTTLTHYFTLEQNKSIQSELGVKLADICVLVIDIAITNCYMKSSKISIVIVDQQSHCLQQVHSNLLVRYKVPAKIYPPDIKASLRLRLSHAKRNVLRTNM
jgi:hypothetical protein